LDDIFGVVFNHAGGSVKHTVNRFLVLSALAVIVGLTASTRVSAQAVNIDAAKKEGKVVVYGSVVL
jgi:hypothetical protein